MVSIELMMVDVQEAITALLTRLDGGPGFRQHCWEREGGGGGVSRTLADGPTFEKAGVNRSVVAGALSADAARRLALPTDDCVETFFATGVSVVVHPRNPMVPTVHLNVRYLELRDGEGRVRAAWFGGGTDLTPTYPCEDDARHFHRALRDVCAPYGDTTYPRYKRSCDVYFRNVHRNGEARGVGGIFFDHLPASDEHRALVGDVGLSLERTYAPIVERHRHAPFGDAERAVQLVRRGRYVEFNLLHDRGTAFGLQTQARADSVLMSLPPLAAWTGATSPESASLEARLTDMLRPRDWL
jgi:coproporphyrinogen III oxidase